MFIHCTDPSFPASSSPVAWAEFLELTGTREERVSELMELGWLQPLQHTEQTVLFRQIDVYKTRKVDRLCDDFELPSLAGIIIVDLLERIEDLEKRLRETER
jgi:chaperone modulatory protein CbpM